MSEKEATASIKINHLLQEAGWRLLDDEHGKANILLENHVRITRHQIDEWGEDFEKIMGLDIGADDYIVKPFSPGEVMARVRAILRRISREDIAGQLFAFDNLTINLDEYITEIDGTRIPLTKKETEILWTLSTNKNKVFSRDNLLESLWGYDYEGDSRTVDSHIKRLRAKLDEVPHEGWDIRTIWGVGYKFEVTM